MKLMTIFGTRPEIIRLSLLLKILDKHCDHVVVHTGQNFHESLSDIFLTELDVRPPDEYLGVRSTSFGEQAGQVLHRVDLALEQHKPDRVLILGDTNSALSAIVAARRGIPVFHMEAGNRCYDERVPEEINRRIIDHSSTILMPYTERSRQNLLREGIDGDRIFVTGNPIFEVLESFLMQIENSSILETLNVKPFEFFLVTLHRAENVDLPERLASILEAFDDITTRFGKKVLVSVHPRTREKLGAFDIEPRSSDVHLLDPLGFFDFVKLEKNSRAVLTDSGTVQEECSIFGIPNVTVRDVTERPETVECGSNILSGGSHESIVNALELAITGPAEWSPPPEYLVRNVSQVVSKIVLGHLSLRSHSSPI